MWGHRRDTARSGLRDRAGWSCDSLPRSGKLPLVSLEAGSQRARGMVKSGLRSPERNSETIGHLGERQADVVAEHEHRALVDGQPPERSVELVAIVDGRDLTRLPLTGGGEEPDRSRPATAPPGLR